MITYNKLFYRIKINNFYNFLLLISCMENIDTFNPHRQNLYNFKSVWEQKISEPLYYAILFQSPIQIASETDILISSSQPYISS